METKYILMILFCVQLFLLYYFREKDIRKNARILDSDKEIISRYFQNNIFALLLLSLAVVFMPYTFELNNNYYIILYVTIIIILFISSIILHKKYLKLSKREKSIVAIQKSNFRVKTSSRYKNRNYLNEIEKRMIRANNHFKFTIQASDLTIQNIQLNKNYVNLEFKEFYKKVGEKEINPRKNLLYRKLIFYINKKLKYNHLKTINLKDQNYKLVQVQVEIFKKVKELNDLNFTLKIGQLFSISKNTFDMQFLSFIDSLKTKKYNNDSLMYALLFMKGKLL